MSSHCYFDRLPVELLHSLFVYFSADELIFTYSQISDYLNEVLLSYSDYRLDLKSIRRSDFDVICHRISPNQVISLTLSDDRDTPGQSKLFISRFRIENFTRLRSLILIQIEVDSLKLILSSLHRFNCLRSLSINTKLINHIGDQLINVNFKILPQLNRLHLKDSTILKPINLINVRYLKLEKCSCDELEMIFQDAPQLKSLDVCLDVKRSKYEFNLPSNYLIRLNLKIENHRTSMDEMEQFLIQLPYLKYFEVKTDGLKNLFNGYRWQRLVSSFITFNFVFHKRDILHADILNSFTSSFWIEEKRWFVSCQNYYLFSIPHFFPRHINISYELDIHSTAPDNAIFYDHINKITVNTPTIKHNYYFTSIKTLELKCSISLKTIASIIDLNRIKYLSILSFDDLLKFSPLDNVMPQLCELTIEHSLTSDMIEKIKHYRFEQIHKLRIGVNKKYNDYIIEQLFILFPRTEHFTYVYYVQTKTDMIRCHDELKDFSTAFFFTDISFYKMKREFYRNLNSISHHSGRITKENFICRFYNLPNTDLSFNIHWWIEEEPSIGFQRTFRLIGRRYWYRFKYIFLSILDEKPLLIKSVIFLLLILLYFNLL